MPPINTAVYVDYPRSSQLVIRPAPYPTVTPRSVIIRSRAIAINPADIDVQLNDDLSVEYPLILGSDVAGEIVEVGEGVEGFTVGQRVLALASFFHSLSSSC